MSETNKSFRVRTEVGKDTYLNVNINQTFDNLEILSLKIGKENLYRLHTANYGCVVGRVVANGNFGIPNAKISIFISAATEGNEDSILSYLYPYSSINSKNDENIRYNLLTEEQINDCHRNVGTFPTKRRVLDDSNVLEVFDKYYKYTTSTNASGDFMLFGVPVGNQILHTDIDLSDVGLLSQKPRDMLYKGYTITQFENANQFKSSTDLDSLSQIISENTSVYVYPFWGEEDESDIKITRSDVEVSYKFEPTCVFMGSLVSDERSEGISKKCIPTEKMGKMDRLTAGQGTIEMIRKKPDNTVEEYSVQGNQLIDGNGTWCYQIPMNLDYMATDEYGNLVPTDDPSKGIPTRARVRFRVSLNDFDSDYENNHLSKILVPNNPKDANHLDYVFGSKTQDEEDGTGSFRDLFWNNVYTVKSYIPRIQKGNNQRNKRFTGIKQVNVNNGSNPIPYNNMRVQITFLFMLQCAILKCLLWMIKYYNIFSDLLGHMKWGSKILANILTAGLINLLKKNTCLKVGDGICPDLEGWYFAPGCSKAALKRTLSKIISKEETPSDEQSIDSINSEKETVCLTSKIDYLMQCIEINLAMEYDVIQFDFYNDWINGMLYLPRWFVNIRKKRSYLFGLIRRKGKVQACMEGSSVYARRFVQQCAMEYAGDGNGMYHEVVSYNGCKSNTKAKCHKAKGRKYVKIFKGTKHGGGIVHNEKNMNNKNLYYFRPAEWINNNNNYGTKCNLFATDIVLLGSLKECDNNGIPQAFKELVSSSYQMPSNLATTNMDNYGFMYGYSDKNTVCNNTYTQDSVQQLDDSFETYKQWQSRQDFSENEPNLDSTEYPITESAGIDWGYTGPGQSIGKGIDKTLYTPGGHFLGISCKNAEVNIKSCVNLSRVCEIGAMISQRQAVMKATTSGGTPVYSWAYLIPNGLISKDEINDANFRNIFATMNYNHLATEIDADTNCRRYKMTLMRPTNFNGELEGKIKSNGAYFTATTVNNEDEYRRTLEENSKDYYLFRLGNTGKDKFLINNGRKVSLPVYDNSYYFYFGLKNGSTSFDRFMNDYYAQCPKKNAYESQVKIDVTNPSLCVKNDGQIIVTIKDVQSPFTFDISDNSEIKYNLVQESANVYTVQSALTFLDNSVNVNNFIIKGFNANDYTVEVNGYAGEEVSAAFSMTESNPKEIDLLQISVTDFINEATFIYKTDDKSMKGAFSKNNGGYIEIVNPYYETTGDTMIVGLYVYNDEYYNMLYGSKESLPAAFTVQRTEIEKFETTVIFSGDTQEETAKTDGHYFSYLWNGNDDFTVGAIYNCGSNNEIITVGTFSVAMNGSLDFYIGDTDCRGKRLQECGFNVSQEGWYLSEDAYKNLTPKEEWSFKKGLFYTGSVYNRDEENIIVGLINAVPPTTIQIQGAGELIDGNEDGGDYVYVTEGGKTNEEASLLGYTVSIDSFVCPTVLPTNMSFKGNADDTLQTQGFIFDDEDGKADYNYAFSDSSVDESEAQEDDKPNPDPEPQPEPTAATSYKITYVLTNVSFKKGTLKYSNGNTTEITSQINSIEEGVKMQAWNFAVKGAIYQISDISATIGGKSVTKQDILTNVDKTECYISSPTGIDGNVVINITATVRKDPIDPDLEITNGNNIPVGNNTY